MTKEEAIKKMLIFIEKDLMENFELTDLEKCKYEDTDEEYYEYLYEKWIELPILKKK